MKNQIKAYAKWIISFGLVGMCSCAAPVALQRDYDNFSEVYGDAVNRQLLLNLAREAHEEPAYFIQLASISSQYQITTSAGFTPSDVRTGPVFNPISGAKAIQHALTWGGSANAGVVQQPVFQFLPLTGSNYVQGFLTPITEPVFWTFYDQGWPADQVARTMLASIEMETTNYPEHGVTNHAYTVYANDPTDPTYPQFLKLCNDFNNAQLFHLLVVDKNAKADDASILFSNKSASLKELVSATAAGLSVKYDDKSKNYVVTKDADKVHFLNIDTNSESKLDDQPIHRFYIEDKMFAGKSEAEISYKQALIFAEEYQIGKIRFITRTFEEAMNAVANEQRFFKNAENTTKFYGKTSIAFNTDPYGTLATVKPDVKDYPPFTIRPILMIQYRETQQLRLAKVAQVNYEDELYTIGDLQDLTYDPQVQKLDSNTWKDELKYQNRTVFSILSYLFSQTAIDTSKLPIQQLIQVQ